MSRLSGVGARLGLALFVVLAGALALVYAIVVPSLESRLVSARVDEVELAAAGIARELPANRAEWPDFLESASTSANARVVVFDYAGPPSALLVVGDSHGASSSDVGDDRIALRAAVSLKATSGTARHSGERYAEAASPVAGTDGVVLVQSPLHDALTTVRLTRNRLLLAGWLALVAALAVGYLGAWLFARRLRKLETAADRIAAGRFDEPVRDTGADEVGQLARTFDRMRVRLATLDHARREFVANASHELRTPLFALGGFLELLSDEELDERTRRDFLATMREQVDRLAKLATELLDLSRVDAGQLRVESEALELGAVVEAVVDEFGALAHAGGRSLEASFGNGSPVMGDPQRVLQIARVLVENALVHTPPGTQVRVRADRGDARRRGRRAGDRGRRRAKGLRTLLSRGGQGCLGERVGPRDRERAGRGDGRVARARVGASPNRVHAVLARCCSVEGRRGGRRSFPGKTLDRKRLDRKMDAGELVRAFEAAIRQPRGKHLHHVESVFC